MEPIRVSAVVIRDGDGRVLTVRKQNTSMFMLPGGKPDPGEGPADAAVRECFEELGVAIEVGDLRSLGEFEADAANEAGRRVIADVFEHPYVRVDAPRAEIAELEWRELDDETVAPLLRDAVFPVLRAGR
ncbi:NUDIX hydrolase [Gordonia paraffinivorans]|uniref:NUDIX hydrolase n=1 Tax=Gordonia paraffinivorans TaxID=175628 RepID=UPI001C92D403|nr:NUDIX domain-containing protein [Gordonia paraffinivorans]MBY4573293.1 NUDIX hydrolase [Gordonia paraffinivorans]